MGWFDNKVSDKKWMKLLVVCGYSLGLYILNCKGI